MYSADGARLIRRDGAAPVTTAPLAQDTFTRTTTSGWGTADIGGDWSASGTLVRIVADGQAGTQSIDPGATQQAWLDQVSSEATELQTTISADAIPDTGALYLNVQARRVSATSYYTGRVKLMPDGSVQLHATAGNGTAIAGGTVAGLTYAPGDKLRLRVQVEGTNPTTIRAKVWDLGDDEPADWQVVTTDNTPALQTTGSIGLRSYLTSTTTNGPISVSFDDLWAGVVGTAPGGTQAPTAVFTSTTTGLSASFDASGSMDPDGSITSYAWDYGDGGAGAGVQPSHVYAASGTYPVTLTVTDNAGATAVISHDVTVAGASPAGVLAQDAFTRTLVQGWGTAETGGPWTTSGSSTAYTTTGTAGAMSVGAGQTLGARLDQVASDSTEVQATVALDGLPDSGPAYVYLQARRVDAADFYAARLRFLADGSVALDATAGDGTPIGGATVPGLAYTPGDRLRVRVQVEGTNPTTIRAKVWDLAGSEPAGWQVVATDTTTALQTTGSVALSAYLSASANAPVTVTVDDLWAATVGTTAQTMTAGMVAPLAALLAEPQGVTTGATGTTLYLPGGQELTMVNGQVTATRYYTFAGQTIAVRTGPAGTDVTSLVADPHATATIALTNDAADTMTVRRTDPYGGPRGTQPDWPGDHGFLNKPVDATGLIAIGARYYDAAYARFISVDPIMDLADPNQWNAYAYANNNPVTYSDPTGKLYGPTIDGYGAGAVDHMKPSGPDSTHSTPSGAGKSHAPWWKGVYDSLRKGPTPCRPGQLVCDSTGLTQKLYDNLASAVGLYGAMYGDQNPGHALLDVAGMAGPWGSIADGANAIWYGIEGNWFDAGLSGLSVIPILPFDYTKVFRALKNVRLGRIGAAAETATPAIRNAGLAGDVHPVTGVPFDEAGFPDFAQWRHPDVPDVSIEPTGTRAGDFARANEAAGLIRTPEGYTWHHHQDYGLMQLVDRGVHAATGHTGGFSIWGRF